MYRVEIDIVQEVEAEPWYEQDGVSGACEKGSWISQKTMMKKDETEYNMFSFWEN